MKHTMIVMETKRPLMLPDDPTRTRCWLRAAGFLAGWAVALCACASLWLWVAVELAGLVGWP